MEKRAFGRQRNKWSGNRIVIFVLIIWFEVICVRFKRVNYTVTVMDFWIS